MALLHLENIGKIYVSEGSVAVGIRGVCLDFDIGEFVAVTGESGSGKTTLLNVISGMDTYEEGELYVQGEPTSHFSQSDWELYRERYVSFIFQDYNIIESFTVLQNVELALSHIEDKKERHARALELISRVGLDRFKNHKGSKLSGGQKQRTVIARALAKDSPIILADEPTGNLDSKSAAEIVALLAEIAREKLVIVVTHSIAELQQHATREIRVFSGSVEKDTPLREAEKKPLCEVERAAVKPRTLRRAAELGTHRFFAAPKLSAFMCMLMVIAMVATFLVTALCVGDLKPIGEKTMFTYIPGRTVIVRQDGKPITQAELDALVTTVGAESALRFDALLDHGTNLSYYDYADNRSYYCNLNFTNDRSVTPELGRLPERADEVFLYLPIGMQPIFGKDAITKESIALYGAITMKVVGVAYYYDNTRPAGQAILTQEGFELLSVVDYLRGYGWNMERKYEFFVAVTDEGGTVTTHTFEEKYAVIDTTLEGRSVALRVWDKELRRALESAVQLDVDLSFTASEWDRYHDSQRVQRYEAADLDFDPTRTVPNPQDGSVNYGGSGVAVDVMVDSGTYTLALSPALAKELLEGTQGEQYTQSSLFFESDRAAQGAQAALREAGYLGVLSSSTYADAYDIFADVIEGALMWVLWGMLVLFLTIFIALCSTRAMAAKRGDLAILRSMGIPNRVIKLSGYAQTALALIPAMLLLALTAVLCYRSPLINPQIAFLHAPQYVMIIVGLLALSVLVTHWHNKRMFRDSVRKTLRGGEQK